MLLTNKAQHVLQGPLSHTPHLAGPEVFPSEASLDNEASLLQLHLQRMTVA